jgi:hypothetical protein
VTEYRFVLSAAAFLMFAAPSLALADDFPGTPILDMRLRAEFVDQDGLPNTAQAVTLRTRLGYETPAWKGFKALVEGENVAALAEDYNSTLNGKVTFPVVSDPEVTQMNRWQLSWTGAQGDAIAGRQRIILGNSRFIGNSGFRQTEQTFDAVRADWRPTKDLSFTYAYVDKVHRVFTERSPQGTWNSDSHLFEADYKTSLGLVTAYGYLLDFTNAATQSNASYGLRFAGAHPLKPGLSATYEAEAARQTDYANSPTHFDLSYLDLALGLKAPTQWAYVGFEQLGGDGRRGFQTPLATLHIFQGWADVFLTTPPAGIRDVNLNAGGTVKLGGKLPPLKLQASAHDFTDDDGSSRYGRELDLLAGMPISKRLGAELKAAFFDGARPGFADRSKVWMTLEYKY